jgi:hypothetical protein
LAMSTDVLHFQIVIFFYSNDKSIANDTYNGFMFVGVVHAYVGQKLLKPFILRVFWLTDYELFHATFD